MGNGTRQARRLPRDAPQPVTCAILAVRHGQGSFPTSALGAVPGADGRPQAAMPSHPKRSPGVPGPGERVHLVDERFTWGEELRCQRPGADRRRRDGASQPRLARTAVTQRPTSMPPEGRPRGNTLPRHAGDVPAAPARRVRSVPAAASHAIGLAERGPDRFAGRPRVVNPPTSHATGMMELTL
jgi:hypothetical protein